MKSNRTARLVVDELQRTLKDGDIEAGKLLAEEANSLLTQEELRRSTLAYVIESDTLAGASAQLVVQFQKEYPSVGEIGMILRDGVVIRIQLNGSEARKRRLDRNAAQRAKLKRTGDKIGRVD